MILYTNLVERYDPQGIYSVEKYLSDFIYIHCCLENRYHLQDTLQQLEHTTINLPQLEHTTINLPQLEHTTSNLPQLEHTTSNLPQLEHTTSNLPQGTDSGHCRYDQQWYWAAWGSQNCWSLAAPISAKTHPC